MQEDIEHRSATLIINSSKFTGRMLKSAISKLLQYRKSKKFQHQQDVKTEVIPHGVDYAVHRAKGEKPRYVVFFKARDADALNAAFEEFTQAKELKKEKPSIIHRLNKAKTQDRKASDLVKNKKKELAR